MALLKVFGKRTLRGGSLTLCPLRPGDHVRQDSMDFSQGWEDPTNCHCIDRLKPLERRAARQHQRCLAHSLVGTPNYIAPEVLLRTGSSESPNVKPLFGGALVSEAAQLFSKVNIFAVLMRFS